MRVKRLPNNPIITSSMDNRIGKNINGPSLIRVPEWLPNPLGKYYLYFAHHQGTFIRLAYADQLFGPWQIYTPGVLNLQEAYASSHIASPDIHVIEETQEIRMYYHGCCMPNPPTQVTRVAVSSDGISFTAQQDILGSSYWRAFWWDCYWYTLEMPGIMRRSKNGVTEFEKGPSLITPNMRHAAVFLQGDILYVFYSNAHDCPECIVWSSIPLSSDWQNWKANPSEILLKPETLYEGCDCPVEPSKRGAVHQRVHQLRDPCVFKDEGRIYLVYSIAGECGLAIAEIFLN